LKSAISEITELREMKAAKYPEALSRVLDLNAKESMGTSAAAYPDALAGLLDLSEGKTDDIQQAGLPHSKSAVEKGSRSLTDTTSAKKWTPPASYLPRDTQTRKVIEQFDKFQGHPKKVQLQ
jgi:hypothetical protein